MADPYAGQDRTEAARLGIEIEDFTAEEYTKFTASFNRQFVLYNIERRWEEIYRNNEGVIRLAAKAAKKQFSLPFGGELPDSHEYGMTVPRAGYFGIGDDWDDERPLVGGAPTYIIDSGTIGMGGTSGNPVKIGGNALHAIIAVGTLSTSPITEALKFTIDGKPKPTIITWYHYLVSNIKVKELGKPHIFRKGTTILLEAFSRTSGSDPNYFLGASFLPEPQLREIDVAKLSGTVPDVVLTT